MKILFLFQKNSPKQEKVLANLVIIDANSSEEECQCSIISTSEPELSFKDKASEKEFERTFSRQYTLLFPQVISSYNNNFVITSNHVSSIFDRLVKEYFEKINLND